MVMQDVCHQQYQWCSRPPGLPAWVSPPPRREAPPPRWTCGSESRPQACNGCVVARGSACRRHIHTIYNTYTRMCVYIIYIYIYICVYVCVYICVYICIIYIYIYIHVYHLYITCIHLCGRDLPVLFDVACF